MVSVVVNRDGLFLDTSAMEAVMMAGVMSVYVNGTVDSLQQLLLCAIDSKKVHPLFTEQVRKEALLLTKLNSTEATSSPALYEVSAIHNPRSDPQIHHNVASIFGSCR